MSISVDLRLNKHFNVLFCIEELLSKKYIPKRAPTSADSEIPANICDHHGKNEKPCGEKELVPAAKMPIHILCFHYSSF